MRGAKTKARRRSPCLGRIQIRSYSEGIARFLRYVSPRQGIHRAAKTAAEEIKSRPHRAAGAHFFPPPDPFLLFLSLRYALLSRRGVCACALESPRVVKKSRREKSETGIFVAPSRGRVAITFLSSSGGPRRGTED